MTEDFETTEFLLDFGSDPNAGNVKMIDCLFFDDHLIDNFHEYFDNYFYVESLNLRQDQKHLNCDSLIVQQSLKKCRLTAVGCQTFVGNLIDKQCECRQIDLESTNSIESNILQGDYVNTSSIDNSRAKNLNINKSHQYLCKAIQCSCQCNFQSIIQRIDDKRQIFLKILSSGYRPNNETRLKIIFRAIYSIDTELLKILVASNSTSEQTLETKVINYD
ncbi:MAG: hypothetical protein MHMPM18_002859 [Marteilia pararefringens]